MDFWTSKTLSEKTSQTSKTQSIQINLINVNVQNIFEQKRKLAACSHQPNCLAALSHFAVAKPFAAQTVVRCGCACRYLYVWWSKLLIIFLSWLLYGGCTRVEVIGSEFVLIVECSSIGAKIQFTITDYSYIRFNTFVWYYHLCHGLRLLNQALQTSLHFQFCLKICFVRQVPGVSIHPFIRSFVRTLWIVPNINFTEKIKFQLYSVQTV